MDTATLILEQAGVMFVPGADRRSLPHLPKKPARHSAIRHALLFLFVFAVAHSAAQTAQTDHQPRKFSGTVINALTKAPIPRALVFTSDNRFAMLTDSEGHFEFTMAKDNDSQGRNGQFTVVSGTFRTGSCSWISARKPGFLDPCRDPDWNYKSAGDDHTIALVPEALIYGRVTLPNGDGLSGTSVQLFFKDVREGRPRWLPRNSVPTNSGGEFRFFDLPEGEYKLFMRERADDDPIPNVSGKSYGYPPVYYPDAADFASAPPIHLTAGQSVEANFSAVRKPYYRVVIPVSSGDFSGLNVTVRAQTGPGFSLGYNASANRIDGLLPDGNYVVEGMAYGPKSASGTVNIKVNGAPVEGPTMTLVPAGSITLDVKEQFTDTTWNGSSSWNDGKRTFQLRGTRLHLQASLESADDAEQRPGASLRPPAGPNDQSLILENVAHGRYWLRLYPARGYIASARMGSVDLLHEPLVVTPGLSAPIEVEMRDDTAEITVTVGGMPAPTPVAESQSTGPIAWVYFVPLPDSPGQFQQFGASDDEGFTSLMMAPGAYRILAFDKPQNRLPYRDPEAMKTYETKGQVVHISAGEKLSVQVPLISAGDFLEK